MEKDGDLDEDSFDLDGLDFSDEETTKPNNNKANGAGGNNKKRKREEKEKEKAEETDLVNKKIQPLKFHRRAFTSCWLTFLRLNLSTKIYKQVLFILHERVIPHLTKPEVLMDFLKGTCNSANQLLASTLIHSISLIRCRRCCQFASIEQFVRFDCQTRIVSFDF